MLEQILAETDKSIEEAVFVGDSIHDIRMANAIQMDSIAVSYGCEKADVLANENPTKLVTTIKELKQQLI